MNATMKGAVLVLLTALISGCVDSGRQRAKGGNEVSDDWEQQQYATTNPYGDGSEGTAYYGAPGPSGPSARRAASPEAAPGRTSAEPRPAD